MDLCRNHNHHERQESQERLIPPPPTSSTILPPCLSLPATASVRLLTGDGQGSSQGHPFCRKSVGFNIDGNIYHYCDYNSKKGLLLDLLDRQGEKGLAREFKLMIPFMYCSGKGITIKEATVDFNQTIVQPKQYSKGKKKKSSSSTSGNGLFSQDSGRQKTIPVGDDTPSDNFLVRQTHILLFRTFYSFIPFDLRPTNTCPIFLLLSIFSQKKNTSYKLNWNYKDRRD